MTDHGGGGGVRALLEDLDQLGAGLYLAQRDGHIDDLAVAAEAEVGLVDRLHGSAGCEVTVASLGGQRTTGTIRRVGTDFVIVHQAGATWLIRVAAILAIEDLATRALPEVARPITARLGTGAVARRLAAFGGLHVVSLVDGSRMSGRVLRVGADSFDLRPGDRARIASTVPFAAVATIRLDR